MATVHADPIDIFVEGWGLMGPSWGISKVMGEIHALLYLTTTTLSLDEISEKLKTSRSNVSLNVRALVDLGIVKKVIVRGERKDYYTAEDDIGKVARLLAIAKKRKELDPAMEIVEDTLAAAERDASSLGAQSDLAIDRLRELKRHMDFVNAIFAAFAGGMTDATGLANVIKIKDSR
ncbi:MAG: transcriptional regulator [Candidatus Krumholzibacteriota bacterium]|nr:transcriptional regulator [Candidatus Krumholzibacteriota bacterium]